MGDRTVLRKHTDFKNPITAFLHGETKRDIYIQFLAYAFRTIPIFQPQIYR